MMANPIPEAKRPAAPLVLVVDDSELFRAMAGQDLTAAGFRAVVAASIDEGLALARARQVHVILLDIELPRGRAGRREPRAGIQAIPDFAREAPAAEIIMISQHDHAELGMDALRRGATDFVVKPYVPEQLVSAVERALERKRSQREIERLRAELYDLKGGPLFFGKSERMLAVREVIAAAAPTDATVLVTGETGTGKELVARTIHAESARRDGPMVAVNLAAVPKDLVESALFGHERGAFTGAVRAQEGHFEAAERGTLFFDEIAEMDANVQVKLLRVLQTGSFERVGSTKVVEANVRIVAATNRDLGAEVKAGRFREDLYYRFKVVPITLPPLRERLEDLAPLMRLFLERYAGKYGRPVPAVHPAVLQHLRLYEWPGNIRELEHLVERIVVTQAPGATIEERDLPIEFRYAALLDGGKAPATDRTTAEGSPVLKRAVEVFEQDFILKTLARCGWNRNEAAERLAIHKATLFRKLNRHGLYGTAVQPVRWQAGKPAEAEPEPPEE
jgi:DNA-binding NtrC family response regulator